MAADKPFITLSGTDASNTVITWSESGEIFESPTLSVLASDFEARYLTIQVRKKYNFNYQPHQLHIHIYGN